MFVFSRFGFLVRGAVASAEVFTRVLEQRLLRGLARAPTAGTVRSLGRSVQAGPICRGGRPVVVRGSEQRYRPRMKSKSVSFAPSSHALASAGV